MDTKKETADQEQETPDTTPETQKNSSAAGKEQQEVTDKEDKPEAPRDKGQKQQEEKEPAGDEAPSITKKDDKTDTQDPHRGTAETPSQHTALDPEGERNNDTEEYKQLASGDESGASTEGQP